MRATRLYKSLCRSVGQSVGLSVGRSVGPAFAFSAFSALSERFLLTAPAKLHTTDAVVYTGPPTAPALHITAPAQHPRLMPVCVSGLVFYPKLIEAWRAWLKYE